MGEAEGVGGHAPFSVGDILSSVWGTSRVNVNFYKVTGVTPSQVALVELEPKVVGESGQAQKVVPSTKPKSDGFRGRKKVLVSYGQPTVLISRRPSKQNAYLWDGRPKERTTPRDQSRIDALWEELSK